MSHRSQQQRVQNSCENYGIRVEICKKLKKETNFKSHTVYRERIKRSRKLLL